MNENNDNLQETTPSIDKIKEANKVVSDTVNEAENTSEKTTLLGELSEPLCKSMDDVWNSHLVSITSSLKLTDSLFATITKQNEIRSAFADPLREMQVDKIIKSIQLISTAIQPYYQGIVSALSDSIKTFSDSYKPLVDNAIKSLVSSQFDFAQKMQQPIQQMLAAIDFSPLYSIFEQLRGFDFSKYRKKLNHIVIAEMYDAKWFPHALCVDDRKIISQFWSILDSTRKSKNRIIHIDKLVYNRYDKTRIENMKKSWQQKNVLNHKYRMMHQAVQAYHRKEYALTVVMLSTLWEGIIYDKTNDCRRKCGNRTKENFNKLISQTDQDTLFYSFFNEYIMYDCRSVEDVIEDVPGRNSSAHSWYSKYPSRKAALNAILFTDFLMNLEPLEEL